MNWISRLVLVLTLFSSFPVAANPVYRINTGGGAYTDSLGQAWVADTGFNTGNAFTTSSPIAGTPDPILYQSERWDSSSAPELLYSLAVSPGTYTVRLHFANIYSGTSQVGQRVFDVN
ncbi:MAG: malectin, partial [Gammaproteobacteria bacterium]|nr:malectin [Gammaproteobacteria bacterium]